MRIAVSFEEFNQQGDYTSFGPGSGPHGEPVDIPSVCGTCSRCGHEVESYGTGEDSIKRTLAVMSEECPNNERNFYIDEDDEDSSPWTNSQIEKLLGLRNNGKIRLNEWEVGFLNDVLHDHHTPKIINKVNEIYERKGCDGRK